ncbi:hypothetical protein Tco_1152487 [Tanacetum coccineum]
MRMDKFHVEDKHETLESVDLAKFLFNVESWDPVKEKLRKEKKLAWENRRKEESLVDIRCRVKQHTFDQLENKEIVVVDKEDDNDDDIDDEGLQTY